MFSYMISEEQKILLSTETTTVRKEIIEPVEKSRRVMRALFR